jgi:hypothetical protein
MPIHGDLKTKRDTFKTTYSGEYNSFNSDSFQPIINVVYRIPDDIDEKEGTMFSGDNYRDENLFFNGLYQVNKIESKFDNGQFLQTLFCSRFNNQQGAGTTPLTAAVNSSTSKITKTVNQNNEDKSRSLSAEQILKDAEKRARELDESLFGQ